MLDRLFRLAQVKPKPKEELHYASLNDRLLANLIDMLCVAVLLSPILDRIRLWAYGSLDVNTVRANMSEIAGENPEQAVQYAADYGVYSALLLNHAAQISFMAVVFIFFWARFGATPGKMLLGLQIVDRDSEEPISWKQAVARYLGFFVSLPPLMIGYLAMHFSAHKQTWHDRIARSVVIHTDHSYKRVTRRFWDRIKVKIRAFWSRGSDK